MSTRATLTARRPDRILIGIILAIIFVAVLNAGISVAIAATIQNRYDTAKVQQQQQGQIVFQKLCTTLNSLHADNPPSNTGQSAAYLQDLHNRLGELATDLKC